jgi:hypothetical protein
MTAIAVPGQAITLDKTGLATDTKQDDIITAIGDVETAVDDVATAIGLVAKEATLQLLKKWPYTTYADIEPSEDVTNTYFTYKTSGGTTVGTVTTNKSTGKITFSPDKVV